MAKQYVVTYSDYNNWVLPLNLAIGFHILIALALVFLPGMLDNKPKFEDIYTVNLISIPEPVAEPPALQPEVTPKPTEPAKPAKKAPPEAAKPEKAIPIAEPVKSVAPPQPVTKAEPVSIKPLKRKVIKQSKPPPQPDNTRAKELERIKRQRLAEALRAEQNAAEQAKIAEKLRQAEQKAAEQARIAAEEAVRQQRLLETQLALLQKGNEIRQQSPTTSGSSSRTLSILENQYKAAILNRILQFYAVPEYKQWSSDTQAIIVVRINGNGRITKQFFEKRSNDATFDQFVRKTIQDADPLPAIPPALKESSYEIVLRFTPETIN